MPDAAQARARRIRHRRDRDDAAAVSETRAHARHSRRQLSHPLAGELPGGEQAGGMRRLIARGSVNAFQQPSWLATSLPSTFCCNVGYGFPGSSLKEAKKVFTSSAASAFSFFGMPAANWIGRRPSNTVST